MRRFPKGTTQTGCRRLLPEFFAVEVYRTLDCRDSRFAAFESSDRNLDGFLLEGFVVLEKVLHFLEGMRVDVREVMHLIEADILRRHREDFVVGFAAVFPKRLRGEPVIKGVRCGGKIDAVEFDESRLLVYLVLIVRAARNLNNSIEFFGSVVAERYIVPQIHKNSMQLVVRRT